MTTLYCNKIPTDYVWHATQGVGWAQGVGYPVFFVVILFSPRFLWGKRRGDSPVSSFWVATFLFRGWDWNIYFDLSYMLSSWVHIELWGADVPSWRRGNYNIIPIAIRLSLEYINKGLHFFFYGKALVQFN